MIASERHFESREALAAALAGDVAVALRDILESKGEAALAVSGGTTPTVFFQTLSRANLPWEKITIALVDERQVPADSPRSNERLVRQRLLCDKAARAYFAGLDPNLRLDAVVLGMGTDGHTASFFPGGNTLAAALDLATPDRVIELNAPGAGEPRRTYTLAALLEAKFLFLHIEGEDKQRSLTKARAEGPVEEMPIRAVLRSAHPLNIYWCP